MSSFLTNPVLAPEEGLYRQVHPSMLKADGTPQSSVFEPLRPDRDPTVSTRRALLLTAREACEEHRRAGWSTSGSWFFTVADCKGQVINDGGRGELPVAHASVDFAGLERRERKTAAKRMALAALSHGCQYAPPENVPQDLLMDGLS